MKKDRRQITSAINARLGGRPIVNDPQVIKRAIESYRKEGKRPIAKEIRAANPTHWLTAYRQGLIKTERIPGRMERVVKWVGK